MVSVASLWLPVLVSAVLVFLASALFHMVLKYHQSDAGPLPDEEKVADALRPLRIPPGDYSLPYGTGPDSPELIEKFKQGPVAILTVMPNRLPALGVNLASWFGYSLLVGALAGYVAGLTLGPGAEYSLVFRVVGAVAFAGYSLAILQASIWWSRSWSYTVKTMADGLVFALLTAGTFGWLWP
ncbi:MAG: hypothetical protein J4F37_09950 [Acidobacteria bacterium]|nr:hypothetical protein [Acidobacteriota bacterium]